MVIGEPPPMGADPNPQLKWSGLPVEVENVICQAMARRPEHRFQWAGEMNDALARALMSQEEPKATPV